MMRALLLSVAVLVSAPGNAESAALRVLTLEQAVRTALQHQPQLRQARASTAASAARVRQALAPLLPQVTGTASYERTTGNYASRPGGAVQQAGAQPLGSSFSTYNYYSAGVNASLLLYDFGQSVGKWRAAREGVSSQVDSERMVRLGVVLGVRTNYLACSTQKALVRVAREQLVNQSRHLRQVEGFVAVGAKPALDLAQARTDRANAEVQVINAENAYALAKTQLNQAMGVEGSIDFDVSAQLLAPVGGEEASVDVLMARARRARPDLMSLERQIQAQALTVRALKGGYWPSLSASTGVSDSGTQLDQLTWNWNAGLTLTWPIYQGGLTRAQVDEANANLDALSAQRDALEQQLRVQVEQARLAVRAAKATLSAAEEALVNARELLRLAEGRYALGVGNIIELGDAQLAWTNAAVQRIQADFNLATARAQLMDALGMP
jgi:outer membrane protein